MKRFALAGLLLVGVCGPAGADSLWIHNGSVMRLHHEGQSRLMTYEIPREGMRHAGVEPGTVFFEGRRVGDGYEGLARVFSSRCLHPMTFDISGEVVGETRIVLKGMRPVFSDCRPTAEMKYEELVFDFISEAPSPEPAAPPAVAGMAEEARGRQASVPSADSGLAATLESASVEAPVLEDRSPNLITPEENLQSGLDALEVGDVDLGLGFLREASRQGSARASLELGRVYEVGILVVRSMDEALRYYHAAAEAGDQDAQYLYAKALGRGEPDEAELEESRRWLERAAGSGHIGAMLSLGLMYQDGAGGPVDLPGAKRLYEAVAAQGSATAAQRLHDLPPSQGTQPATDVGEEASEEASSHGAGSPDEELFRCMAADCEGLSQSELSAMQEFCSNVVQLMQAEGYDIGEMESCLYSDLGTRGFSARTAEKGMMFVRILAASRFGISVPLHNDYPATYDCWSLEVRLGEFMLEKTSAFRDRCTW